MNELKEKDDEFTEHVEQIKDTNNERCFNIFLTKNKSNVFKAWCTYIKHIKLVKAKEAEFLRRKLIRDRTLSLVIWKQRVEKTKEQRTREALLV